MVLMTNVAQYFASNCKALLSEVMIFAMKPYTVLTTAPNTKKMSGYSKLSIAIYL